MMDDGPPILFTPGEIELLTDKQVFLAKARVTEKIRGLLEDLYAGLRQELQNTTLLAPPGFDHERCQFVKGEHLEHFPYQYLDFPKHFAGGETFAFRSLFWGGHHFVFALLLEGAALLRYKQNCLDRYRAVAGRDLAFCLSPSLWEWKCGAGYTLPMTPDRKPEVAAVLSDRRSMKIARFVALDDPIVREGRIVTAGREAFQATLPIITP